MQQSWLNNRCIHFLFLSLVGFLFIYKYGSRVSAYVPFLGVPYLGILYYLIFKLPNGITNARVTKIFIIATNILCIASSMIAFQYIDVNNLQVDRWSVITHYWDTYFAGNNPYSSTSHMGNYYGSYPFYFILSLPFYLIGEIGFAPLASLILFQLIVWYFTRSFDKVLYAFILSMACLCLPYEIVTRSTLFANSVAVLIGVLLFIRAWRSENFWKIILSSFLVGLLVCSRPIYGLVFLMLGVYAMRYHFQWRYAITATVGSIIGFIVPFLHLYYLYPTSLLEYNPVSFMTTHFVPTYFYGIYLVVSIFISLSIKKWEDIVGASALFLFFVVFCYALLYIITEGWNDAIFMHHIDISYFFMPIPFIVLILLKPWRPAANIER